MTKNADGISRRSFCSFIAGSLAAACVTKKVVLTGDEMPASNFASRCDNAEKTHLKWDVWEQGRAKPNPQAAALVLLVRNFPDTLDRLERVALN